VQCRTAPITVHYFDADVKHSHLLTWHGKRNYCRSQNTQDREYPLHGFVGKF